MNFVVHRSEKINTLREEELNRRYISGNRMIIVWGIYASERAHIDTPHANIKLSL